MKRNSLLFIAMLGIGGCASVGHDFDSAGLKNLKPGVTTEAEAIQLLHGEPAHRVYSADGSYMASWQHVSMIYVFTADNRLLNLMFDKNKIYQRMANSVNVAP